MKYLKVQFTEEEFDRIVSIGLHDVAFKANSWIMKEVEKMEK